MIPQPFNSLEHFIGAYFCQECFDWAPTIEGIVERFRTEAPESFVREVKAQLNALIARRLSEDELTLLLSQWGCYYDPHFEFHSTQEWLEYLATLM